jgi:ribosomal protein L40E
MKKSTQDSREKAAEIISMFWFSYKVCDSCEALLYDDVALCPKCGAYRFDETKPRIKKAIKQLLKQEQESTE